MYCSTCGDAVPTGRTACVSCGSAVRGEERFTESLPRGEAVLRSAEAGIGVCPRCTFRGEGLPYFSRGIHAAGLVGATIVTAGILGAGGVGYYLWRRHYRVCPRCGRNWGKFGEEVMPGRGLPYHAGGDAQSRGGVWSAGSLILWSIAAVLLAVSVAELELFLFLLALVFAAIGATLQWDHNRSREARHAVLLSRMQLPVLKLAAANRGRLTVTDVAATLEWPLRRAEKVLESLNDGVRVNSEVTREGVIVYEFRELLHGPAVLPRNPPSA